MRLSKKIPIRLALIATTLCLSFSVFAKLREELDSTLTPPDFPPPSSVTSSENCEDMNNPTKCIICNCYHECRNEPPEGILAVGKVVMSRRRSKSFPDTVCEVVTQKKQFSWWDADGRGSKHKKMSDIDGFKKCQDAAEETLKFTGFYGLNYHADYVSPKWASGCEKVETIETHIFYKDCSYSKTASKNLRPEGDEGTL